ncbi:hypothetical protein A8709_17685 [Paenibacillus pectinilyticus]|uniref:Uncharacterized protein n=1 Tax=Paenibacillus pectinilyticus TaxID=512399 RepID=A0A1C0ZZA8_9BACL|nr:hypothetical protein [Paenibacillus pectinilyticus]OCT13439.1 hypothetical protein A8709_17685 [Paenibacillus pectinilyticus]
MNRRIRWKLFTYVPFLIALLVIGLIQSYLLANETVQPFPEPFGRATELPQQTSVGEAVQVVGDHAFAYKSGQSLAYVNLDEVGQSHTETRPLPDNGEFHAYQLIGQDKVIWIGEGNQLFTSVWQNGTWSSKIGLIEQKITNVRTVIGLHGEVVLLANNASALYVGAFQTKDKISWTRLEIADIVQMHGVMDTSGSLSLVYEVKKEGNVAFHYAQLASPSWQPLVQKKLKEIDLVSSSVDEMALGRDGSTLLTAYTTSSRKSGKTILHMLSFPENQPENVQDVIVNIPVSKGIESDTILHPAFIHSTSNEASLVVSSVYEKNRRQTSQEVFKLDFEGGKMIASNRISQFGGFAEYPTYISSGGNSFTMWLDSVNNESSRVYYATDQKPYVEEMNHLQAADLQKAAETLPLLWGIGLLTALLSFKWILLPGLYLVAVSIFWQYHYDGHPKLHFGISLSMYLAVKALLINDYRKPLALQVMPDNLQAVWVHLIILAGMAAITYMFTRFWRKGLNDRNVGLEMLYFVLLDGFMTNLWYSFFMSPASL